MRKFDVECSDGTVLEIKDVHGLNYAHGALELYEKDGKIAAVFAVGYWLRVKAYEA